jgi:outer membrane murein-binding lipoprotein Lpp
MIGGVILIMCIMLAARPVLGQQPDDAARTARQDTILTRISTLESRIDSLMTELSSLKEAVVAAGISTEPAGAGADAAAAAEPDELEELRAAARREVEAGGSAREEPDEPEGSRTRSLRLLNPEISVTGDVVGSILAPSGGEARATAVPREFEFGFQAMLDPFARTAVFLAREEELKIAGLSEEEEGEEEGGNWVTLEEGYVDWIAMPAGMSLKLGKFRQELGLYNRWHNHSLLEVDRPLPVLSFVGDDGLIQTGVSLALPLLQAGSLTQSTWLDLTAGTNEALFDGGSQPSFLGRTQSFFDLGPASYLQLGVNGVVGRNSGADLNSSLISVDVAYRWTPPARALYQDLQLKAEWYFARRNEEGFVTHGNGGYGQAHYKFARQWQVGFRADYLNPYGPSPDAQSPDVWQFVPSVSWWQSEWVRLRLQGNIVRRAGEGTDFTLFFQTVWAVGPHKHETY